MKAAADEVDLIEQCFDQGWADGLPVVPPTRERVDRMMAASDLPPDEIIGRIGPGGAEATVEKIAANAVMAGCLPAYFPVVLTAVAIAAEGGSQAVGVTIHSMTPMLVVNGPVRHELGFNFESNALGAGNRANATVGRALKLTLQNVAGMHSGGMDAATLGHPGKYSYCFAENEEANPWNPLHVDRGFQPAESTVTVYQADAPLCISHHAHETAGALLGTLADALPLAGTYNMFFGGDLFVVLGPEHASLLAAEGLSKKDVQAALFAQGRRPLSELRDKGMFGYMDDGMGRDWLHREGADSNATVAPVDDPGDIVIVVAGRPIGGYSAIIFGSGKSVTRKIEGGEYDAANRAGLAGGADAGWLHSGATSHSGRSRNGPAGGWDAAS